MYWSRMGVLAAVFALFVTSPAFALDGATIDRWIGSMAELQEWGEEHEGELDEGMGPSDAEGQSGFDFEARMAEAVREYDEIQSIVERHGFSDGDQWANVGSRIYQAYLNLKMAGVSGEMEREMAEAMREMEADPDMTAEQKAQMRRQMEQQMQAMSGMMQKAPETDLRAVRQKEADLDRLFEFEEE